MREKTVYSHGKPRGRGTAADTDGTSRLTHHREPHLANDMTSMSISYGDRSQEIQAGDAPTKQSLSLRHMPCANVRQNRQPSCRHSPRTCLPRGQAIPSTPVESALSWGNRGRIFSRPSRARSAAFGEEIGCARICDSARGAARSHASREVRHTCRQHWAPHAGPSCLDTQGKSTSRVRSVPMEGNSEVIKLKEYMRASQKRPEASSDTEKCHPPSCIAQIATKHC